MSALTKAQEACRQAEALLITAGAGMGVDSGLPDFRGAEGFWKAYPPYKKLGYQFVEMACPDRFADDPAIGWGFYGHRLNLYRSTEPHDGFRQLQEFGSGLPGGVFVFTSNVDGHFQRSGFDPLQVLECHGSILHLQCFERCQDRIWPAGDLQIEIDEETMRAQAPLPSCPDCGGGIARPNILMFGDWGWNGRRSEEQEGRYLDWIRDVRGKRVVVLEFGAGTGVPTVRMQSERVAVELNATLIRVNPREPEIPNGKGVSLSMGALEAIQQLLK
ncbi:MAG: Sir2 family NAD-dependent protein deacetylase [Verrucomicrobiota bacterium]